jgi:diguanylate cyclase (GGDEF)-like protein
MHRPLEIVLVESDRVSAEHLRSTLEALGHQAEIVEDAAAAWRRVCESTVGLLISDWDMPGMNGLELCRRIRARSDAPYTYIILVTARDRREDRLAGLEAGADDFLIKPLDTGELVARLNIARRILAMQDQLRAHATQLAELHAALAHQNALLEEQNVLLAERAATDGLTGLGSRRRFDEELHAAVSFARRHDQPLSLVLLDVDRFKAYNDAFGHLAGDDVLRTLAALLRSHTRAHDLAARYGGEEFALILPATDAEGARAVAERLRQAIASTPWPHRTMTASFGIATTAATAVAPEPDGLIAAADRALYEAKARGRDCVVHHRDLAPASATPPRAPAQESGD